MAAWFSLGTMGAYGLTAHFLVMAGFPFIGFSYIFIGLIFAGYFLLKAEGY
jgi:hypothetical protein